jgi:tetratricopeptide (TPR) repeat protein
VDTLNLAVQSMQANNAAEAEKLLLKSVELDPSNVQAQFTLGTFYFQMTRFDQAIETLEKVEKLAGMFASLPPVPGQLEPSQQAQLQANARKLIDAVPGYKGELALKQKQYDAAIGIFTGILQKDPNNTDALFRLTVALTYAGRLEEAMSTVEKAIEINPGAKDLTDLRQQISIRMENAAIANAQNALNDGTRLLENGDAAGALEKFQQAIGLLKEDKQAPVWRQIGKAQAELKETFAAEEAYKKAIELAPAEEIDNYINNLAQFYLDNKKYEEALDTLVNPSALGDKSAEQVLMELSGKAKDPKLISAALERVIEMNPDNAEAYFVLGRNSYADGKERDSRTKELLNKYIEIGQDPQKIQSAKDILVVVNGRSE